LVGKGVSVSVGVGVKVCVGRGVGVCVLVGRGVGVCVLVGRDVAVGSAVWVASVVSVGVMVAVEVTSAVLANGRAYKAVLGRAAHARRAALSEAGIPAWALCAAEAGADAGMPTAKTQSNATPINVYRVNCMTIPLISGPQKTKSP
jgi:hypothetical protein